MMQSLGIEDQEAVDSPDSADVAYQKWVGKDYYNPFVKDFIELHKPHDGNASMDGKGRHKAMLCCGTRCQCGL